MQHIEDALEWIAARMASGACGATGLAPGDAWNDGFVQGIAARTRGGCALSVSQAEAACRIVAQNARILVESGALSRAALDGMLHPPCFRHGTDLGTRVRREVRLLAPDLLAFRCGRDEPVRHDLRALGRVAEAATPTCDPVASLWLVPLLSRSVPAIREVIARHRFATDVAVRRRLRIVAGRAGKPSSAKLSPDGLIRLAAHDNELLACWCAQAAAAANPLGDRRGAAGQIALECALPATGAMARRLMGIAAACPLELDDGVRALAGEEPATTAQGRSRKPPSARKSQCDLAAPAPAPAPADAMRRAAVQFVLDCGLRCAVPAFAPELDRALMLHAIARSGAVSRAAPLTVVAAPSSGKAWREALREYPELGSAKVMPLRAAFSAEFQDRRHSGKHPVFPRDGVLLLDWDAVTSTYELEGMAAAVAREFPRTVLHGAPGSQTRFVLGLGDDGQGRRRQVWQVQRSAEQSWWEMGLCLFPDMPQRAFNVLPEARHVAGIDPWIGGRDLTALAPLFNVFLPMPPRAPGHDEAPG